MQPKKTETNQIIVEPPRRIINLNLRELWPYHELLFFLVWRDIKVRYRQTVLGVLWAILQPLFTMVIFSVIFGRFAKLPSEGIPYPIFTYTALLPWHLFSNALSHSSSSVVGSGRLLTKVYFPRLIIPLSSVGSGVVDFFISFIILIGLMIYYDFPFSWKMATIPFFILLVLLSALSVGLWLSALNVQYRDVGHTVPFLMTVWMYATPIAYSATLVPEKWRVLYGLNPMVGVVEGFRWMLLDKPFPDVRMFIASVIAIMVLFFGGLFYFKSMENSFADVI